MGGWCPCAGRTPGAHRLNNTNQMEVERVRQRRRGAGRAGGTTLDNLGKARRVGAVQNLKLMLGL